MPKRNWILIFSVAGIVLTTILFLISLLVFANRKNYSSAELAVTRASVERSLASTLPGAVETSADPALLEAARKLGEESFIAWVWLVDGEGKILFAEGGPARAGDSIRQLDSNESDIIDAVEADLLSNRARLELQIAVAIRREGEHNDVYRHLVRAVAGPAGEPAAFVALAYDASPSGAAPLPPAEQAMLVLLMAGFAVYWLGLPLWVSLDARSRGERAALWGLFILLTNLAGFLAYLIASRRRSS